MSSSTRRSAARDIPSMRGGSGGSQAQIPNPNSNPTTRRESFDLGFGIWDLDYREASSFSISSITAFIFLMVRSRGSSVVMSTPASLSRSMGYFDPPDPRKVRYRFVDARSPDSTFAE